MDIIMNLFGVVVLLGALLLVVFLYKAIKNDDLKFKNEKINQTFDDVIDIAFRAVVNLMQTTVCGLKKEGKWNSDIAKDIFRQALMDVKYQMGKDGMELLKEKVTDVDLYLTNLIESIVYETKMNNVEGIDINKLVDTLHEGLEDQIIKGIDDRVD